MWGVFQGSTQKDLRTSNFDSSTWTHVDVTVSGTNIKMYKNGALAGTKTDGHEPNVMTRAITSSELISGILTCPAS